MLSTMQELINYILNVIKRNGFLSRLMESFITIRDEYRATTDTLIETKSSISKLFFCWLCLIKLGKPFALRHLSFSGTCFSSLGLLFSFFLFLCRDIIELWIYNHHKPFFIFHSAKTDTSCTKKGRIADLDLYVILKEERNKGHAIKILNRQTPVGNNPELLRAMANYKCI